jgi:hypothetical protein
MAKHRKSDRKEPSGDTVTEQKSDDVEGNGSKPLAPAFALAAGLVWQDRLVLIPWYLLLVAPEWILVMLHGPSNEAILFCQLAACTLEIVFMYYVCRRWICRLSRTPKQPYELSAFFRLLLIGYAFWMMLVVPLVLSMYLSPEQRLIPLMMLIPALIIMLRFYFYFFPAALHERSVGTILQQAKQFTENDKMLALKVLAAPIGLMLLSSSLIGSISPDGRERIVLWLASLTEGIFPILKAYLGFAVALYLLNDAEWHKQELDPYRNARLNTLELGAPAWLAKLLSPKTGVYLIAMGILVWIANQGRAVQLPPTPTIGLQQVVVEQVENSSAGSSTSSISGEPASSPDARSQIVIELDLHDSQYHFRGFFPHFFNLSGESGVLVASQPASILVNGIPLDTEVLRAFSSMDQMTLKLTFFSDRSTEQLTALEDLHLWYRRARLIPLNMKEVQTKKSPAK